MVNQFFSGFERDISQQKDYDCIQCSEPITNPVCHTCLGKSVEKWLSLYPSVKKKFTKSLKDYVKDVDNELAGELNCVSCGKKKAALCPYCFAEAIYYLLKKSKIDKMVIMDFLYTFNFDSKHEGYIQEAIMEGLY
jgi:predicted AlkP superfamily phosphohydrolase/phosphomutase